MKKIIILTIVFLLVVSFFQSSPITIYAQETKEKPLKRGGELEKHLEVMQIWKLVEILGLSEEDALKFFPAFNKLREARQEAVRARKKIIEGLENLLKDERPNSKLISQKLSELEELNSGLRKKEEEFNKVVKEILSPEQQAKLVIFLPRMHQELETLKRRQEIERRKRESQRRMREEPGLDHQFKKFRKIPREQEFEMPESEDILEQEELEYILELE